MYRPKYLNFFQSAMKGIVFVLMTLVLMASPVAGKDIRAGESPPAYDEELLAAINRYRQENGLQALQSDQKLVRLAKGHSNTMYRLRAMNHDRFEERFKKAGATLCVENVGWNYLEAEAQFKGWRDSFAHNRNMLAPGIRQVGVAVVGTYVTFFACN